MSFIWLTQRSQKSAGTLVPSMLDRVEHRLEKILNVGDILIAPFGVELGRVTAGKRAARGKISILFK